jgi:hypothetical protein
MTRILLIQTASPKRICAQAEQILQSNSGSSLELCILCDEKDCDRFRHLPQTTVCSIQLPVLKEALKRLPQIKFDRVFVFWTGEKKYRSWKILAFRLQPGNTHVIAGDGNEFRLTWKAICKHAAFRFRHPLPTDHSRHLDDVASDGSICGSDFHGSRENVLIVQSAEPHYVLKALETLREHPQFKNPAFTLFCRNKTEIVSLFTGNPLLHRVVTHSETQNSIRHLVAFRRQHFDGAILFLTGDPSYWKVKIFAFLLGARRILVFNEEADCFFFSFHKWLELISYRMRVKPYPAARSKWGYSARILLSLILKSVLFPFRFLWLLLVWLRLRMAGLGSSRESHDCSL